MRLDHLLVTLGFGSRREVQKLVRSGSVLLEGKPVTDPGVHTVTGRLTVAGTEVDTRLNRHLMMNKPAGVLTAARDKRQHTVMDLLPKVYTSLRCMPCGRLDKDTEGLLLFTTDGELSHRLLSPQRHVEKCYEAVVEGRLTEADILRFAQGMDLGDFVTAPARLEILSSGQDRSTGMVVIHEGKFHQVRRMFDQTGHPVLMLKRISFGPLVLPPSLSAGGFRELTGEEEEALYRSGGMQHVTDVF